MALRREGQQMSRDVRTDVGPSAVQWLLKTLHLEKCVDYFVPMSQKSILQKQCTYYENQRRINERIHDVDVQKHNANEAKFRLAFAANPQAQTTQRLSEELRKSFLKRHRSQAMLQQVTAHLSLLKEGQKHLEDEEMQHQIAKDGEQLSRILQQQVEPATRTLGRTRKAQSEIQKIRGRMLDINDERADDAETAADNTHLLQGTADEAFRSYLNALTENLTAQPTTVKSEPVPALPRREAQRLQPIVDTADADDDVTEVEGGEGL